MPWYSDAEHAARHGGEQDPYRVYLRNLHKDINNSNLQAFLEQAQNFEPAHISNIHCLPGSKSEKTNWIFLKSAFVTFISTELRDRCCRQLDQCWMTKLACAILLLVHSCWFTFVFCCSKLLLHYFYFYECAGKSLLRTFLYYANQLTPEAGGFTMEKQLGIGFKYTLFLFLLRFDLLCL